MPDVTIPTSPSAAVAEVLRSVTATGSYFSDARGPDLERWGRAAFAFDAAPATSPLPYLHPGGSTAGGTANERQPSADVAADPEPPGP